ncbi:transposase [Streptomyces sp. NPDC085665]|uniref:transposase n=1 Tax=Streptomyces sp. NPDC085665 TaxID=3365735 RepID=UPI0037D14AE8
MATFPVTNRHAVAYTSDRACAGAARFRVPTSRQRRLPERSPSPHCPGRERPVAAQGRTGELSRTGCTRGACALLRPRAHSAGHELPAWIEAATTADLPSLQRFARQLERDPDAVTAGLSQPWNSGVVEGHVNRIKMLKRQMFGRAGFELLRKRVLLAN